MPSPVHLIGPGGAGKTSAGALLAQRLGGSFIDLDEAFMTRHGDIARFIAQRGYGGYARSNVVLYEELARAGTRSTVIALSSGFMTYPLSLSPGYPSLRRSIELDPLTVLLLPAFDLETCVETTVKRQLARPYLNGDRASEEQRIRTRHPHFMALRCERVLSDDTPSITAERIERFVQARVQITPATVA